MLRVKSLALPSDKGRVIEEICRNASKFTDRRNVKDSSTYQVVRPGVVSPIQDVPKDIVKPEYVTSPLRTCSPRGPIAIYDEDTVSRMRESCNLTSHVLKFASKLVQPDITTDEIDTSLHEEIIKCGGYPSTLHYKGYPKSCCTSVNNVVCHGIPDNTVLQNGDIVNIDVSVYYMGCHGDTSDTFPVGDIDSSAENLILTTRNALSKGINACRPGAKFSNIATAIEPFAIKNGFQICKRFVGHGIGDAFHMPPNIYHYSNILCDRRKMAAGMIFTIEPILMEGSTSIEIASDGWTALSKDNFRSAQAEHTVLVTEAGVEILTQRPQ